MPGRDRVRVAQRHARLGAGRARGDQRLGLAPAAVGGQRRAFEPVPGRGRVRPRMRPASPPRRRLGGCGCAVCSAWACRCQAVALGVMGAASAAARRAAVEQVPGAVEVGAERGVVPAGAGERGQFGLGAQALGAELDPDLRRLVGLRLGQPVVDGPGGVGPAALPQGEFGQVGVVQAEPAVLAQGGARGLEVGAGGVELTPADLDVGADDEGHVRIAGAEHAEGSHAGPFGFIPVADGQQRLDLVGHQHRGIGAVAADGREPLGGHPGRLPGRPSIVSTSVREMYARCRAVGSPVSPASRTA